MVTITYFFPRLHWGIPHSVLSTFFHLINHHHTGWFEIWSLLSCSRVALLKAIITLVTWWRDDYPNCIQLLMSTRVIPSARVYQLLLSLLCPAVFIMYTVFFFFKCALEPNGAMPGVICIFLTRPHDARSETNSFSNAPWWWYIWTHDTWCEEELLWLSLRSLLAFRF